VRPQAGQEFWQILWPPPNPHPPGMKSDTPPSTELEATLVVRALEPAEVLAKITHLTALSDFDLRAADALTICDLYFDTENFDLREKGWGLRVRTISAKRLVTLKGSPKATAWGAVAYTELEREWSPEGFSLVFRHLAEIGVSLGEAAEIFDAADPVRTMKTAGLDIIQDRETYRQVLQVLATSSPEGRELAELVADRVTYRFMSCDIIHHEVEIEARRDDAGHAIMKIQEALLEQFGPLLRTWVHSKLATGIAIERLISLGELDEVTWTGTLMPAAYDRIEALLSRGEAHWR